jgi:hypothetical protein
MIADTTAGAHQANVASADMTFATLQHLPVE